MKETALVTNVTEYTGPGVVEALVKEGYTVFCHSKTFDTEQARRDYEAAHPGCIAAASQQATALAEEALQRFGHVTVLVSNDMYRIEEREGEIMRWMMETLLMTPYELSAALIPAMQKAGGGRIVLVTSGTPSRFPQRTWPADKAQRNLQQLCYNVARSGVNTMARYLAKQHAAANIQVNAVAPSYVYSTTFFPNAGPEDPAHAALLDEFVPMGRFGTQQEIGALVAFLVSGKSSFVSGQIIGFNGAGI